VGGTKVHEHVDGIAAGVGRERPGDDVDRVGEGRHGELLAALDAGGFLADLVRDRNLGCACAGNDFAGFQRRCDDVERVTDGSLEFVDDVFGPARGRRR